MQVPIPQVPDSTRRSPGFTAPAVAPHQDPVPGQLQQQAQALGAAGDAATRIAIDIGQEHAAATAKAALNQWAEFADSADLDYRGRAGAEASQVEGQSVQPGEAPQQVARGMEDEMSRLEAGLPTDLAKRLFRERAERGMVTYRGRLMAHEAKQIKVHDRAENAATVNRFTRSFEMSGDPAALTNALAAAGEIADSDGMGKEARREFLLGIQTSAHAGHIGGLLAEEEVDKADEHLRGIPRDGIDPKVRSKLRSKINRITSARKAEELGVKLVQNNGYGSRQAQLEAAAKALPDSAKADYMRTAVMMAAGELGLPDSELVKLEDGGWQDYANHPSAIAKIPEVLRTFDQEIILARDPGQPPAGAGTLKRSFAAVDKAFQAGEIDASQLRQAKSVITEQVRLRTVARNVETNEVLEQVHQILQQSRETGGPGTVDSPVFQQQHPALVQRLMDLGAMPQARRMTDEVFQRASDPAMVRDFYRKYGTGELGEMSYEQVYNTYYHNLDETHWREVERRWSAGQTKPSRSSGVEPGIFGSNDEALTIWAGKMGVLTGTHPKTGLPMADPDKPEEMRRWHDLQRVLDRQAREASQSLGRKLTIEEAEVLGGRILADQLVIRDKHGDDRTVHTNLVHEQIARLRRSGQAAEADSLQAELDQRVVSVINGKTYRVGGTGKFLMGTDNDPIPMEATNFIRDRWRIDLLRQNGHPMAGQIEAAVIAAGGASVSGRRDMKVVESLFGKAGLAGKFPPLDYQARKWDSTWQHFRAQRQIGFENMADRPTGEKWMPETLNYAYDR